MSGETNNKVKFGLSNVHIAKITEQDGQLTYGTPFAMPGAVALSADPEGETTPFYADNIQYYVAVSNNGYTGELEIAMAVKEFLTQILGQQEDTNGALFESSDDVNARFALMGEIEGDVKKRRFVYYDCTAARPSSEMNTVEDTKEPQTDTIEITMSPRATDRVIKAVIEPNETNKAVYDTFFTKVYEKNAQASV
jgi:phi13 family phage major tail protein